MYQLSFTASSASSDEYCSLDRNFSLASVSKRRNGGNKARALEGSSTDFNIASKFFTAIQWTVDSSFAAEHKIFGRVLEDSGSFNISTVPILGLSKGKFGHVFSL